MRPALLVALLVATAARAGDDPTRRRFDADPSRLSLSLDGGFVTGTAAAAPDGTVRFGALLEASSGLLVLRQGETRSDLLGTRGQLHLLAGWSLGSVELAAHLPVALFQNSDFSLLTAQGVTGPLLAPIASTALGDLRLGAKVPLLDAARFPVGLAALLEVRLPTGNAQAFLSDGFAVAPGLVVTRTLGRVRLDAQAGYVIRGAGQYAQLVVPDGFFYGAGASMDVARKPRLRALLELEGGIPRGEDPGSDRHRAPLSARAGLRAFLTNAISVEAGLGTGLGAAGYGHERWRAFFGLRFGSPLSGASAGSRPENAGPPMNDEADDDGDGIPNAEDKCPDKPGPASNDGCPVGEPVVSLEDRRILVKDSIQFDIGKESIKADSLLLLDRVARLLQEHPELKLVRVEGHTDNVGNAQYNKDLSARRAQAVVRYLIGKGVAPARLQAVGYGFEQPLSPNVTALGRAKNRRVVFTVLEVGGAR